MSSESNENTKDPRSNKLISLYLVDSTQAEEITRTILDVIEARGEKERRSTRFSRFLRSTATYWTFILFLLSIIFIVVGFLLYSISPRQLLDGLVIEYREQQERDDLVDDHVALGYEFLNSGEPTAAKAEFAKAQELDPTDPRAQEGLFKAEIFQPYEDPRNVNVDSELLRRRLRYLEKRDREDPYLMLFLGNYYSADRPKLAVDFYRRAYEENPNVVAAYAGEGWAHDLQNKTGAAVEKLRIAARKSPWHAGYLEGLGYVYLRTGQYDKAIVTLSQAVGNDPYYLLSYLDIVEAFLRRGEQHDTGNAVVHSEELVEKMESKDILSREINQAPWYEHLEISTKEEPNIVWFDNDRMTRSICYYWAALTVHIFLHESNGDMQEDNARSMTLSQVNKDTVQEYVQKAESLRLDEDEERTVKMLLDTDIRQLQYIRPELRDSLEKFRQISHVESSE